MRKPYYTKKAVEEYFKRFNNIKNDKDLFHNMCRFYGVYRDSVANSESAVAAVGKTYDSVIKHEYSLVKGASLAHIDELSNDGELLYYLFLDEAYLYNINGKGYENDFNEGMHESHNQQMIVSAEDSKALVRKYKAYFWSK